jgi:hypothetical protein
MRRIKIMPSRFQFAHEHSFGYRNARNLDGKPSTRPRRDQAASRRAA